MRISILLSIILFFLSCHSEQKSIGPNIIFIFADDLGYGDIGCFGATDIKTPNIDRIAKEGIKFTDLYSASSVCSPSRAGLLTGRYPQRWGLHGVFFPNSLGGMPAEELTVAETLRSVGYETGIVGKWHLGHTYSHLPLQQGFHSYFGIPYSNDMESVVYMKDNEVVEWNVDQSQMIKRYAEESVSFIDENKDDKFYLYLAHNMPHVPIYASDDFLGSSERGLYGDVIQEIDWSVGQILDKLERENLLENTLIVFSSDNGPWLVMQDHGGSPGELREGKQFTFDGGVKVPTVAMWKNNIDEGQVYSKVVSQMDWFPTFNNLAGATIPDSIPLDGMDISSILLKGGERGNEDVLLFGINGKLRGFRDGKFKLKLPYEGFEGATWRQGVAAHDTLLFNLADDVGEQNNLVLEEPAMVKQMYIKMHDALNALGPIAEENHMHRTPADHSFIDYLREKNGPETEYWKPTTE